MSASAQHEVGRGTSQPSAEEILDHVRIGLVQADIRSCLVAFSGGPDSMALAWAVGQLRVELGLEVALAHFDHGLDTGSASRARASARGAAFLGLPFLDGRAGPRPAGTSLEAWARRERYAFLERTANRLGLEGIATAHHADDQAETVLLRLLFGTGLHGLGAIRARHGLVIRPLLDVRRRRILEVVREVGLPAVRDPTNEDLARPRNRIRHRILPEWSERDPELVRRLCGLARTAAHTSNHLDQAFTRLLAISPIPGGGATLDVRRLAALPKELHGYALSALDRAAGRPLPTPTSARQELMRQIEGGVRIGCDAGSKWRWQADSRSLRLLRPQKPMAEFTYTVKVPGSVTVTELDTHLRIVPAVEGRAVVADRADQALIKLPSASERRIEVRNRRPGDRLRPQGRHGEKRLKDMLIDRRIPRDQRDRLPLLVVDGQVAWVPGVALDLRFAAHGNEPAWLVELRGAAAGSAPAS